MAKPMSEERKKLFIELWNSRGIESVVEEFRIKRKSATATAIRLRKRGLSLKKYQPFKGGYREHMTDTEVEAESKKGIKTEDKEESKIINLLNKKSCSVGELSRLIDRSKETVILKLDSLREKGYDVEIRPDKKQVVLDKTPRKAVKPIELKALYRRRLKFGLISDTHLTSIYQQLTLLHTAYKVGEEEKIDVMFNAGDITDGYKHYRLPEYTSFTKGTDEIVEYCIEHYPRTKLFKTKLIGGRHDLSTKVAFGYNMLRQICEKRDDLAYVGDTMATFVFKGVNIKLIHPTGGTPYSKCFDDKTRILTENGWKYFSELEDGEKVATLNLDKDKFEWQVPTENHKYSWKGDLIRFKARCVDLLVSPEHRMLVRISKAYIDYMRKRHNRDIMPQKSHRKLIEGWRVLTAEELKEKYQRQYWEAKKTVNNWTGDNMDYIDVPVLKEKKYGHHMKHIGRIQIRPFLRFLGWYLSEGNVSKNLNYVCITQSLKNKENRQEIIVTIKEMGITPCVSGKKIQINSKEFATYMHNLCGTGSKKKYIPRWIKRLNKDLLEILLKSALKGDGSWSKAQKNFYALTSFSDKLRNDYSEIMVKCGYSITLHKKSILIQNTQKRPTFNSPPKSEYYDGYIYDVSVPNKFVLVERNGRVVWSGNSYRPQKVTEAMVGSMIQIIRETGELERLPQIIVFGHLHQAFYFPYLGSQVFCVPALQSQTPYLEGKGLYPDVGMWIIEVFFDEKGNVMEINPKLKLWTHLIKERDY